MKKTPLLLLAAIALLSGCVNPIERRVSFYPGLYSELTEADKQAVHAGQVHEGMSKNAVYLVWGAPPHIQTGKREGKPYERWSYPEYQPVFTESYGAGFGFGYWGRHRAYGGFYDPYFYGGPSVAYVPHEGRFVEFVNGRVTSFLVPVQH